MLRKLKTYIDMKKSRKNLNLQKEEFRGTLKQIMKVRGLRTISLSNYNAWKGNPENASEGIHSVKLDIMSGYLNIYPYGTLSKTGKFTCGEEAIENASAETYRDVYRQVINILNDEASIPGKVRRNILVRVAR